MKKIIAILLTVLVLVSLAACNSTKTKNEDDGRFSFSIPYEDIVSHPVRKWEIRTKNIFNSIELNRKYSFHNKILTLLEIIKIK